MTMSPYLEDQPRSQARVLHDQLERGDLWQIVELTGRGPEPVQDRYWHSLADCVRDIATECDGRALAVTCVNFTDGTSEIIDHDKLVAAVLTYFTEEVMDGTDDKRTCPFLDESRPYWRADFQREWDCERAAREDAKRYARAGL